MKYKNAYSSDLVIFNHLKKTITIKYNKNILKGPGLMAHFDNIFDHIKKTLIPLIDDDLKKES